MKTLTELRTEIDLGMETYPETHHDVIVTRLEEEYVFLRYDGGKQREKPTRCPPDMSMGYPVNLVHHFFGDEDGGGGVLVDATDCYETFDELLEDWPDIASQPIWSTTKSVERVAYETRKVDIIGVTEHGGQIYYRTGL